MFITFLSVQNCDGNFYTAEHLMANFFFLDKNMKMIHKRSDTCLAPYQRMTRRNTGAIFAPLSLHGHDSRRDRVCDCVIKHDRAIFDADAIVVRPLDDFPCY